MIERNWRDLIKPKALDVEKESLTDAYGKFVARPLERGFGLTLGNSLRRVLLSSLQGAAITAIKIDGVVHEFSTLEGVREDVVEIILNLKEIRFKLHSERATVAINVQGPCEVFAKDIICSDQIEVMNGEQKICTVEGKVNFKAEIHVEMGRGYRAAENNKSADLAVGWIPVDSFFSPVRRVNYNVTQSRVGQRTDFDKLTLELWTDGSVKPDDAVALGSKILKDQLSVFLNFEEEPEAIAEIQTEKGSQFNPNLYRSVEELELSVRSANCLQNASIRYIYELVQRTEAEMLKTKNFGRKSLNEIKEILGEMGLSLGMKLDGFVAPAHGAKPAVEAAEVTAGGSDLEFDSGFDGGDDESFDDEDSEE
jgi:DNA-directed RNA polymerase subunit alpha